MSVLAGTQIFASAWQRCPSHTVKSTYTTQKIPKLVPLKLMNFQRGKDQPILKNLAVQKGSLEPAVNAECQKDFWVILKGVAVIPDKNKVPIHPFANPIDRSYKIYIIGSLVNI